MRSIYVRIDESSGKTIVSANFEPSIGGNAGIISDRSILRDARKWLSERILDDSSGVARTEIIEPENKPANMRSTIQEINWTPPANSFHAIILVDLK